MTHAHAVESHAFVTGLFDGFDWTKIIFSDETTISTDYRGPVGVYSDPGHRYDPQYVNWLGKSGRISVSRWGSISQDGASVFERIYGRLDSAQYLRILENAFLPIARNRYPEEAMLF